MNNRYDHDPVRVRPELPADLSPIHLLLQQSFPTGAEAELVAALRTSGRLAVSLVADDRRSVVGHIAFSPLLIGTDSSGVGLAPLAVAETHRRRGIAAQLVSVGLNACQAAGWQWCAVLGDPDYYRRFGFQPAANWGFWDEFRGGEAFQVLELAEGGRPTTGGLVRYSPEFDLFKPPTAGE